jgi:hypothetical protein
LLNASGDSVLPLKLYARFTARFPAFGASPIRPDAFLEWRIYEVIRTPALAFEGLSSDRWMSSESTVWIKPAMIKDAVWLKVRPFVPRDGSGNVLHVHAGDRAVADCPTAKGVAVCRVPPTAWAGQADDQGWVAVHLRAERTYSPLELGMGAEPRRLSFNFAPSYQEGLRGLLGPGVAASGAR